MNIKDYTTKEVKGLTEEENIFIAEHKEDLTAGEQEKFGLREQEATPT